MAAGKINMQVLLQLTAKFLAATMGVDQACSIATLFCAQILQGIIKPSTHMMAIQFKPAGKLLKAFFVGLFAFFFIFLNLMLFIIIYSIGHFCFLIMFIFTGQAAYSGKYYYPVLPLTID
jgi:hypothetical protein